MISKYETRASVEFFCDEPKDGYTIQLAGDIIALQSRFAWRLLWLQLGAMALGMIISTEVFYYMLLTL
jgi:hypothetical protein